MILHKLVVIDAELSPMGKVMAGPTISCLMWNGGGGRGGVRAGGAAWACILRCIACASMILYKLVVIDTGLSPMGEVMAEPTISGGLTLSLPKSLSWWCNAFQKEYCLRADPNRNVHFLEPGFSWACMSSRNSDRPSCDVIVADGNHLPMDVI